MVMTDDVLNGLGHVSGPSRAPSTIIAYLMDAHLIACANLFPVESSYWWEGQVERPEEWMALMKIRDLDFHIVQESILRSPSLPGPLHRPLWDRRGHPPYLEWVIASTAPPQGD